MMEMSTTRTISHQNSESHSRKDFTNFLALMAEHPAGLKKPLLVLILELALAIAVAIRLEIVSYDEVSIVSHNVLYVLTMFS